MHTYARVIEVLEEDLDWRAVVVQIAKTNPGVLIKAAATVRLDWRVHARELFIGEGKKIDAIKYCRSITGFSLKDANEAVGALA